VETSCLLQNLTGFILYAWVIKNNRGLAWEMLVGNDMTAWDAVGDTELAAATAVLAGSPSTRPCPLGLMLCVMYAQRDG